jgi:hypothetical protein
MEDTSRPKVLIVCGDPGGAGAVSPVIKSLESGNRVQLRVIAYNEAADVWDGQGIVNEKIPNDFSKAETAALLRGEDTRLLFTGTSVNGVDLEKQFIAAAVQDRVPALSLIDFWTNYTWRFSDEEGALVYVPDKIAIMDKFAFDEMVREGFDPAKLVITGQPVFDDLAAWRQTFSPQRRYAVREALGVALNEILVLFTSQPLTSLYGTDVLEEKYLGFDEWSVLKTLIQSLEAIKTESGARIHLVVRPHPRESSGLFRNYKSNCFPITVVESGTARSQVMAADLVVGMNTELLVEACYLDCITLSLQPGLRHPDRLPTNRLGVSRAVYCPEEIKPALEELLLDESARNDMLKIVRKFKLKTKSTGNVVNLIYDMIGFE